MDKNEIRRTLAEFLEYLIKRSKECSDTDQLVRIGHTISEIAEDLLAF